jgi:hypothetical protein
VRLVGLLTRMKVAQRRGFAAWVVYAALIAVLYAVPGPLVQAYAATSAGLLVVTSWLVVGTVATDRSTTTLLAAAAGGPARLHVAQVVGGALAGMPLAVIAIVWGLIVAWPDRPAQVIAVGIAAHLLAILVGAGIGAVAARPVLADGALSLTAATVLVVLVLAVPWTSPYGPALKRLSRNDGDLSVLWVTVAGGVGWAIAATAVGAFTAARRRAYGLAAPDG